MPGEARPMVLRSINLPPELDDQLRAVAFVLRRSKSDLIRLFVADGLKGLMNALRSARDERMDGILQSVLEGIDKNADSTGEQQQFQDDFARMQRFIDRNPGLGKAV